MMFYLCEEVPDKGNHKVGDTKPLEYAGYTQPVQSRGVTWGGKAKR